MGFGLSPAIVSPGFGGFVGVRWPWLSLSLEGRGDLAATTAGPSRAHLSTSLAAGSFAPCLHWRWLLGCGLLTVGALHGAGVNVGVAGMAVVPMGASDFDRLFGDARQAPIPGAPDSGTAARIWSRLQERCPSTTLDGSLPLSAPLASPAAPAARTLAAVFATGVGLGAAALFALLPLADPTPVRPAPSARAEVVIVAPSTTTATTRSGADALAVNSAAPPVAMSAALFTASAPTDADEGDGHGATEGTLIQRASAALAAGRSGEAIKLAQSHAKKYPRGRMGQERDVILIQALVLSGQREKAIELADRFRRASPASPFLPTIDAALGAKPSP